MPDYNFKERRFSIDPGKGRKMDGCPYSVYEDGRDVKDYIIPPSGYVFKGFRFDPDAVNQIYDGKLIAEYEKEPFNAILKSNLWKFILAFAIIAVIAIVVFLAASVFDAPKPSESNETQAVAPVVNSQGTTSPITVDNESNTTPKEKEEVSQPVKPTEEPKPQPVQPLDPNDPSSVFNAKFWTLIHQCEVKMDPYDSLYRDNKNKVKGDEYDYLRLTILENYAAFQSWSKQLKKVPLSELEAITTVEGLKQKLNATH